MNETLPNLPPDFITRLAADLRRDEGVRSKPYQDSVGLTTIGVGRNLDGVGLSDDEIDYLLNNDMTRVIADLDRALPWWRQLTPARQLAMANLCFNLGITKLLGFKNTLRFMAQRDYARAADNLLASLYAKQVGQRATRIADAIRKG